MTSSNLHINHLIGNKYLQFGVAILATVSLIVKPLKVHYWRTSLIKRLNKRLNQIYLISEGTKSLLSEKNSVDLRDNIQQKYREVESTLNEARNLYLKLEKANFFNNKTTRELSEGFLSNFYDVEVKLRHIAFEGVSNPDDETLFGFASQLSLGSLPA